MPFACKSIVGLDIGIQQTKIVQMGKNLEVLKWSIMKTPEGCFSAGSFKANKRITEIINAMLRSAGIKKRQTAFVINSPRIGIKRLRMPKLEGDMLLQNIDYELSEYKPADGESYMLDYKIYSQDDTNATCDILSVILPESLQKECVDILEDTPLDARYIDVPANTYSKLLSFVSGTKEQELPGEVCVVDIGATTQMFIFSNCEYRMHRNVMMGTVTLSEMLASHPQYIGKNGEIILDMHNRPEEDFDIFDRAAEYIFDLINEINKFFQYMRTKRSGSYVDKIYITGGLTTVEGLCQNIQLSTGVSTEKLSEFVFGENCDKVMDLFMPAISSTIREEK